MTANELLPLASLEEELDPLLESTLELEETARDLDLEDWIVERLRHPQREITANLTMVRDNGQALNVTAFRVQHSDARGPGLGGVRFSPHAQLNEIRAAAMNMTWQCALLDVPFGGAAGALVCDPAKLSERELRHLSKDYVEALRGMLGPVTDVLMEDAGSNPEVLAWMLDAQARLAGHLEPGAVAGKPAVLFGLPDHADAVAQGIFDALQIAIEQSGGKLSGLRVALQGFGQTGSALACLLDDAGARLVAVADISGGLQAEAGLPVPALLGWIAENGVLLGFPEVDAVSNAEVLQSACDVLVLSAAPRQVTAANAAHIAAPLVVEALGGAISQAAAQMLEQRGVIVVPAILAGAGATAAAYIEWSRNLGHEGFLLDGVGENIRLRIRAAYGEAQQAAQNYQVSLRRGALLAAVEKLAQTLRLR